MTTFTIFPKVLEVDARVTKSAYEKKVTKRLMEWLQIEAILFLGSLQEISCGLRFYAIWMEMLKW